MIDLLDVTLLTISGTDDTNMFLEHLRSLCYSKKHINFGKIKIFSPWYSRKNDCYKKIVESNEWKICCN